MKVPSPGNSINHVIIDAHFTGKNTIRARIVDCNREELIALSMHLYMNLSMIQRDATAVANTVKSTLGDDDNL